MPTEVSSTAGHRWSMHDPGGRVGRRLRSGVPYEHRMLDHIRRRRLSGSALDVGAHVGNHALYLALACGLHVHAFEPSPQRAIALAGNVALNEAQDQVTVHTCALGASAGRAAWVQQQTLIVGSGPVDVCAVDDLLDLDDLALVKIDVEGMESQALQGMVEHLARCRPVVYVEAHTEADRQAQAHVLVPLGYQHVGEVSQTARSSRMDIWEVA